MRVTWCITEKGPQKKWLHRIKKADTAECDCHQQTQTGGHLVAYSQTPEDSSREKSCACGGHATCIRTNRASGAGETETEKLESFFCHLYEFHNPASITSAPVFVPAELPPRYSINFVPSVPVPVPASVSVSASTPVSASFLPSTEFSIVSPANFVNASDDVVIAPAASVSSTDYSVVPLTLLPPHLSLFHPSPLVLSQTHSYVL